MKILDQRNVGKNNNTRLALIPDGTVFSGTLLSNNTDSRYSGTFLKLFGAHQDHGRKRADPPRVFEVMVVKLDADPVMDGATKCAPGFFYDMAVEDYQVLNARLVISL